MDYVNRSFFRGSSPKNRKPEEIFHFPTYKTREDYLFYEDVYNMTTEILKK
jgi:hypothetical protein